MSTSSLGRHFLSARLVTTLRCRRRRCSASSARYSTARLPAFDGYLLDMDGVIYYENVIVPHAKRFLEYLRTSNKPFVFVTNSSASTAETIATKVKALAGVDVTAASVVTSARVTAQFVGAQCAGATCFVIGGDGIRAECVRAGLRLVDDDSAVADYVIVGEGGVYDMKCIQFAVNHISGGASVIQRIYSRRRRSRRTDRFDSSVSVSRLIGTNNDAFDRGAGGGIVPACGALTAVLERSTGVSAHFCGKPSPLMMAAALAALTVPSQRVCFIGDRMDTDIVGAAQFGITSALVLTGVTKTEDIRRYAVRPQYVLADLSAAIAL